MKLTVLKVSIASNTSNNEEVVQIELQIDMKKRHFEALLKNHGGINAITYDDELLSILWRDLGLAKNLHHIIWDVKKGKSVSLPFYLGEF